ncbi:hypothetical protein EDM68_02800 [Candidatus Uhrbacteria bacterium]|nr:MAG: hypothetical protein EDM68_02800 [Candidatus Uhrbacteria bacterium]
MEHPPKNTPPESKPMEGRYIDSEGKDHGDKAFHETHMNTDMNTEREDLEALATKIKKASR